MAGTGSNWPFRSAPPRRGRLHELWRRDRQRPVSIRAPAKGATRAISGVAKAYGVSIRAPAKGATSRPSPRAADVDVSIRAPAKGATIRASTDGTLISGFDPRPREGGDGCGMPGCARRIRFRSAPPRRGRPNSYFNSPITSMFRSAPPRRGRPRSRANPAAETPFRSAPPRRGRRSGWPGSQRSWAFRSAPPRRGRRPVYNILTGQPETRQRREPVFRLWDIRRLPRAVPKFPYNSKSLYPARTSPDFPARLRFARIGGDGHGDGRHCLSLVAKTVVYTISVPPRSVAGLAPTCSIRGFQFDPR